MPRWLGKSLLVAAVLALAPGGGCADSGLRGGNSADLEQSERRVKAKVKPPRTKAGDERVLQAAKHAHGNHDCEIEITFITPDYSHTIGSPKDVRFWERQLAKASKKDLGVFGSLELKKVEVDFQAATPVDMKDKNRRNLAEYPYWYEKFYKDNFYWGFNSVQFWSNLGKCRECDLEQDHWEGNSRNLKFTNAASARFAERLFKEFTSDKKNKWMNNMVYVHAQGDCGPGLKIDAVYLAPPPKDMPLVADGNKKNKPIVVDKGKGKAPLIVDGN